VITAARNDLAKLKAGATAEDVKAAEIAVEQAKSSLWAAQVERDGTKGAFGKDSVQGAAADARVSAAEQAVNSAQNALAKVKAGPRAEDISTAEARLAKLEQGTDAATIANAKAQLDAAQAKLDVLKTSARASDIASAQAEIRRAQAQLELVQAGARAETIAAAAADVLTAKAAVDQAKSAKADTELRAPFAGTVAAIDVAVGESASTSTPIVKLADLSEYQVETTDLTELKVSDIREGAAVTLKFDAIPDLKMSGTVDRVKTLGEKKSGDVLYTVIVKPAQQDPRLRWNMTAAATIEAAK
jgi:HlyD family secretion protein